MEGSHFAQGFLQAVQGKVAILPVLFGNPVQLVRQHIQFAGQRSRNDLLFGEVSYLFEMHGALNEALVDAQQHCKVLGVNIEVV
jgi:hypothetical protein